MKRSDYAAALVVLAVFASAAQADTYPSRPITLYVGFPPGGPTDTLARIIADGMKGPLGQPIVIEDVTGASGSIAAARVAHAAPDGYSIGIGNWSSHVGSPAIYPLDFDVFKDLAPISLLATSPLWVLGKKTLPPNTATELIAWLKERRDRNEQTTFGTVGAGSPSQLVGISLTQAIGAKFQFVPYRGAAPAMQDLAAGQIDLSCLEASATLPNVEAGRFKAFAVMSEQRWPKSPNTPTMNEAGVPGVSISFWHGLWAPNGTPPAVIDRLDEAVMAALADPAVRQHIETIGQVIYPRDQQNPKALLAYHQAETAKWWPIMKAANIKAKE